MLEQQNLNRFKKIYIKISRLMFFPCGWYCLIGGGIEQNFEGIGPASILHPFSGAVHNRDQSVTGHKQQGCV